MEPEPKIHRYTSDGGWFHRGGDGKCRPTTRWGAADLYCRCWRAGQRAADWGAGRELQQPPTPCRSSAQWADAADGEAANWLRSRANLCPREPAPQTRRPPIGASPRVRSLDACAPCSADVSPKNRPVRRTLNIDDLEVCRPSTAAVVACLFDCSARCVMQLCVLPHRPACCQEHNSRYKQKKEEKRVVWHTANKHALLDGDMAFGGCVCGFCLPLRLCSSLQIHPHMPPVLSSYSAHWSLAV